MKIGTVIQNDNLTLTVAAYHETKKGNVALLIRTIDTPYVCVRDLTREKTETITGITGIISTILTPQRRTISNV